MGVNAAKRATGREQKMLAYESSYSPKLLGEVVTTDSRKPI